MDEGKLAEAEDRRSQHYVTAFARGLQVIEAFGPGHRRMTVADVAARVGLDRAVTRRLLLTLVEEGFAQFEGKHFELTTRVLRLGYSFLASVGLTGVLQPYLDELSRSLDDTVSVSVLQGNEVIFVARSELPGRRMAYSVTMGMSLPAFASASGRLILSTYPVDYVQRLLSDTELTRFTPNTVTNHKQILSLIKKAGADGFVVNREELELGVVGIAVLVHDRNERVVGTLNASANAARVTDDRIQNVFLPELRDCAERITKVLI